MLQAFKILKHHETFGQGFRDVLWIRELKTHDLRRKLCIICTSSHDLWGQQHTLAGGGGY